MKTNAYTLAEALLALWAALLVLFLFQGLIQAYSQSQQIQIKEELPSQWIYPH